MMLLILALAAAADHRNDRATPPALEEERAFEGTWELVSEHYGLKHLAPVQRRLVVGNGSWHEEFDGRTIPLVVRRRVDQRWPLIDRTRDLTWKSRGVGIT